MSTRGSKLLSIALAGACGVLFLLALAVILARQAFGRDAGITALAVVVFAFTVQLAMSAFTHGRSR